jgi:hypothetical protein
VLNACGGEWGCFFGRLSKVQTGDFVKPQQEKFDEVLEKLAQAEGGGR